MGKLLASSNSLDSIKTTVTCFFFGPKSLVPLSGKEWLVTNIDGTPMTRAYRVVLTKGRYRLECTTDSGTRIPKAVLKLIEGFNPDNRLCYTEKDFGDYACWWVYPSGKKIDTEIAMQAVKLRLFKPCNDGLFGFSQTFEVNNDELVNAPCATP